IRGQILVCLTIGTSIAVVLGWLGVEYAILIGVFAGVIDFIPYAGVALGMIPAFFISLANHGLWAACGVLFVMWCIHQLEGHVIVPAVLGQSVGLPSLVVIASLLAGAELAGIMGMFLAIPVAAIVRVLGQFYVRKMEEAHGLAPPASAAARQPPLEGEEDAAAQAEPANGEAARHEVEQDSDPGTVPDRVGLGQPGPSAA
ncbi:MAG: AI-2E family transporter, partial [Candidatus Eremiobacterota bacterium]